MASFRIKNKLMTDTFSLPKKIVNKLAEAGEVELKILILLASLEGGEEYFPEEELFEKVSELGMSESDFSEGLAFLRGAGLIEKSTAKKKEKPELKAHIPSRPTYKSADIAKVVESSDFR